MTTAELTLPPAAANRPSFERRLHTVVLDAYDANDLATLVRFDLGVDLFDVVAPGPFGAVAAQFIMWANGAGRLVEFLDKVAADMPHLRDQIAALRDEHLAETAAPGGLPLGEAEAAVERFAGRFRARRPLVRYLKAYKQVHEVLHDLANYLGQVRREADARRAAGAAVSDSTARALRHWVAEAGRCWGQTEQPTPPPLWVKQFADAVAAFLGPDPAGHAQALRRLDSLPALHLVVLNADLLRCAVRLGPDDLLPDLDAVRRVIGPRPAGRLAEVAAAVDAFRDQCGRLSEATRHDTLCQQADTELRAAGAVNTLRAAQGLGPQPAGEMLGWDVVAGNLASVADERPGDTGAATAHAAAEAFAVAPTPAAFAHLVAAFGVLFKAMDVVLLSVATDLPLAADRLSESLGDGT